MVGEKTNKKTRKMPRISIKSVFYVLRLRHKAIGPRSYFLLFHQLYVAIVPSVMAIVAGHTINAIVEAATTHNFQPFVINISVLIGIEVLTIILRTINNYLSLVVGQRIYCYVSEMIATQYIRIPLHMRESREFADKFERVQDFGGMMNYMGSSIMSILSAIVSIITVFIATVTVSPLVTLIVVVATIPSAIISLKKSAIHRLSWWDSSRDRRIAWEIRSKLTNSNNALEIEMNGLSEHLVRLMVKSNRRQQERDLIEERKFIFPSFGANVVETASTFGVLIFVAFEIINGRLGIGQFMTVRNLLSQLNANISMFFDQLANVSENIVNSTDFMEFMNASPNPSGDIKITGVPKIEFKGVSFRYPNAKDYALKDINFVLEPGESLALVGENGAGKTTLVKLLIGAYEPTEGTVLVNDEPLASINRESYLAQIGALFQDYARYEFATLGENVWFGNVNKPIDRKAIKSALRDVGLEDIPKRYEKGLNQIMSKDYDDKYTADLSGGQWQRLSIARAFYRSPNVLILDEPTSAIDAKSEYEIFQNIAQRQQGKTTLIISHRFSTVRKANQIIVLDKGKIIESGSHDELIANKGTYKELFEMQAEGYN